MAYIIINLTQGKMLGGTYTSLKSAKDDYKEWKKLGTDRIVLTKIVKN